MNKPFPVRTIILAATLLLHLTALCLHSYGAAGDVDLSFDPGSGVNGAVYAVAVQPDGKAIIGGQFTTVRGLMRTNLARLNADGSGDPTFNPIPAYNPIHALALQADGQLLVGTFLKFTVCEDEYCDDYYESSVVRLNADGSRDDSFQPATAQYYSDYGQFSSLVVQPDGKVLVGGTFTSVNGTNRNFIARLNANGTLDPSFNPGTGANGLVTSIATQSDGKVIIGGHFTTLDGTNRQRIARLNANGSLDGSFVPDAGIRGGDSSWIESVALQSDGKVLAGGNFTNTYGNCIARFNVNGTLDSSFNSGTGANGAVSAVALQPDGKVLIGGGYFTAVNGTNRNGIARLDANGTLDVSFNPGTGITDYSSWALKLALQADGKVLVGGNFTTVNGANRNHIARLHANGSLDEGFDPGSDLGRAVFSLALHADGKVLVGRPLAAGDPWPVPIGDGLALVNGTNQLGRARLHANGTRDSGFISTPFDPPLSAFFHTEDCFPDPSFGCYYGVVAAAVLAQADGKVLVGGNSVTTITGELFFYQVYRPLLARFTASGALESSFEPVIGSELNALAQQPDGKILIGGYFSTTNDTHRNIARLNMDGSLDNSFNPGAGANGRVAAIALQSDGRVLIGGDFTAVNGTNRDGIARLNSNGSLDDSFNPAPAVNGYPNRISAVAVQPDGKMLIGGDITAINGTNREHIARLEATGSLDTSFHPGTGPDARVRSIVLQPDGKVLIGGDFTTVNGVLRLYVARLFGNSIAPALNITQSGDFMIVSWPSAATGFVLQQSIDLKKPNWTAPPETVTDTGTTKSISVSPAPGSRFFRLYKP